MPYIERITIRNHWRAPDMEIDLWREGERPRHLILTGPNGSGKTTILRRLVEAIEVTLETNDTARPVSSRPGEDPFRLQLTWSGAPDIGHLWDVGLFVTCWLSEDRLTSMDDVKGQKEMWLGPAAPSARLAPKLHQYLVNQFVERGLRAQEDDEAGAADISRQIRQIEGDLSALFEVDGRPGLTLKRRPGPVGRVQLDVQTPGHDPVGWEVLAAGHRSVLQMLGELALRIDASDARLARDEPELSGVAVIDEMALHLHPSLQEKILPFLVRQFPRIQFIVATHSPAIISSVGDALVVDLRTDKETGALKHAPIESEELRGIRYGDLMTGHFDIATDFDLESTHALGRLFRLWKQSDRTQAETNEMYDLAGRLANRSHALALEIMLRAEHLEHERS